MNYNIVIFCTDVPINLFLSFPLIQEMKVTEKNLIKAVEKSVILEVCLCNMVSALRINCVFQPKISVFQVWWIAYWGLTNTPVTV